MLMPEQTAKLKKLATDIISYAMLQPNVSDVELSINAGEGVNINVRNQELETIEHSLDKSLYITVYKGKAKGSVAINNTQDVAWQQAVFSACQIAEFTQADSCAGLADKNMLAVAFPELDLYHDHGLQVAEACVIAKECEQYALAADKRIVNSEGASIGYSKNYYIYANSNNFIGDSLATQYFLSCCVIGEHNQEMQRDYQYTVACSYDDLLSSREVGLQAANKTLARLGSCRLATCQAAVLFAPEMATSLLRSFVAAVSGKNLYRKASFLCDSVGKQIFSPLVNLAEHAHKAKGLASKAFDAEGVATLAYNPLVSQGVLQRYLLSSYSARKLNLCSTANAGGVHNLMIQPGEHSFAAMLQQLDTGLLVTELMGHGVNLVTGDYSQGAAGFWVQNGKIQYPVHEITIAGNLHDMFKQIVAVGNDLVYKGSIVSGSLLVENMTIAGT